MGKGARVASLNRRRFLQSTAAAGSAVALSASVPGQPAKGVTDTINLALLGSGDQGQILMGCCLKIPGVRFKALCDIWKEYNQEGVSRLLKAYRHEHTAYEDFREMLKKEKDLDAAIIATPDFCHAEQTVACLKAGLHVYCETPMSNTLDGARQMAQAAKQSGKLLQIGTQRRSNPRYIHCGDRLLGEVRLLGRVTTVSGQWNQSVRPDRGWPKRAPLDGETLAKYGFKSMDQFRNWRWYKGLGGGPLAASGSHQIDVFNWFLGATPKSIMASGGTDYYDKKTHEWPDTVMAVYEYETRRGTARALYQIVNTNGNLGHYEKFLGDEGCLVISETGGLSNLYREASAPDWDRWVNLDYLTRPGAEEEKAKKGTLASVTSSVPLTYYTLPFTFDDPCHKPHLENFFEAIRGKAKLNCPAGVAYATAVTVFKTAEAVETGQRLTFKPDEFTV